MMPGEDGLSPGGICVRPRSLPVIMLTAMAEDTDRDRAGDGRRRLRDQTVQPARAGRAHQGVLRRANSMPRQRVQLESDRIRFDRWTLDAAQRELIDADGVAVPLSTVEFLLLSAFVNHPRMVRSRDQLLDLTRGRAANVFDRSVDNQVSRLRRKIERDPGSRPDQDALGRRLQFRGRRRTHMRRLRRILRALWPRRLRQLIALLPSALVVSQAVSRLFCSTSAARAARRRTSRSWRARHRSSA